MKSSLYAALALGVWSLNTHVAQAIRIDPYQTVYLYIAYQLDNYANGARPQAIANNCPGSIPNNAGNGKVCDIWEFLTYIQNDDFKPDASSVPTSSNPLSGKNWVDPVQAASYINRITIAGQQYYQYWDIDKIFRPGSVEYQISTVLDIAGGVITAAVTKLGSRDSAEALADAKQAMTGMQQAMTDDFVPTLVEQYSEYGRNNPLPPPDLKQLSLTAVDGSKFNYLDLNATMLIFPGPGDFPTYWSGFLQWMTTPDLSKRSRTSSSSRLGKRDDAGMSSIFAALKLQSISSKVSGAGRRQSC